MTRKHQGINQKTGHLKKGYKYSGKRLKSGLPEIIKSQKGGTLQFKPKHFSEKKYNDCRRYGCPTQQMPYCCPEGTKARGYCRIDFNGCMKTGMDISKRKRNLTDAELKKLRKNMAQTKKGRFEISIPSSEKYNINIPKNNISLSTKKISDMSSEEFRQYLANARANSKQSKNTISQIDKLMSDSKKNKLKRHSSLKLIRKN